MDDGFLAVQSVDQAVKIFRGTQTVLSKCRIRSSSREILEAFSASEKAHNSEVLKLEQP